jgi:hypothetical protein
MAVELKMIEPTKNATTEPAPAETPAPARPETPPNVYDLSVLALTQDFTELAGVTKLLRVPIRKPKQQDFVRTHPDPAYRSDLLCLRLEDDDETYLVHPRLGLELANETKRFTVYTAINRQGTVFLWPVPLPLPDGRSYLWWQTAREAAELATTKWVRLQSNLSLGAYDIHAAGSELSEPQWPQVTFQELINVGFNNKLITQLDHPVIQRLRGLIG